MSEPTRERVQAHRARLRRAGLRPVQIWVPDARRGGFAEECRRQALVIAEDAREMTEIVWLEEVADTDGWQ